ncbi:MAG: PadR family transcriptional regulator [Dehalococcoidales bacterium]|nr:MAG: PadR family transcriptional regulator [Dehalococcoidales bacterium]
MTIIPVCYNISSNDIATGDILVKMAHSSFKKYLPLSEATYYIMLALINPLHGYGVMQEIEKLSQGTVKVGPGTLYGVFSTLEKQTLIYRVKEDDRRKYYALTPKGKEVLKEQIGRLKIMTDNGSSIVDGLVSKKSELQGMLSL